MSQHKMIDEIFYILFHILFSHTLSSDSSVRLIRRDQAHFRCSVAMCGQWLLCRTVQLYGMSCSGEGEEEGGPSLSPPRTDTTCFLTLFQSLLK